MYYQILSKSSNAPNYRGVQRYGPFHRDELPESAPYNIGWRQIVDRDERFESEEDARRTLELIDPAGESFDIIGVELLTDAGPHGKGERLGYDVASNGRESILSWGIQWDDSRKKLWPLGPLLELIEDHYRLQLNRWGLFSDIEIARQFRNVIAALQDAFPGVWEAPGHYNPSVLAIVELQSFDKQSGPGQESGRRPADNSPER